MGVYLTESGLLVQRSLEMTTHSADGDIQERQHTFGFQFRGELDVGVLSVEELQE